MRYLLFGVLTVSCCWAQQRNVTSPTGFGRILFPGGTAPSNGTNASPFGRIIYPGTGAPAVARQQGANGFGNPAPAAPHPGHSGPALIPYPVYFGGGNYVQYDPPQAQLAKNYVANPQQQDASPVVIVNQYFRPDAPARTEVTQSAPVVVRETRVTVENQDKDIIFLIAMKDHTIYAASAYWVEDGTLNYVTIQGSQNSASMDLVDRELSRRLNRDRSVAFGLPGN
jgi:hypothetical protein